MSQPSPQPHITPRFCFNETALRDFLRTSRATLDDSITQHLNALNTPSLLPFSPTSTTTTTRQPRSPHPHLPASSCAFFKNHLLFPAWQTRSDVLTYCGGVATSPDPDDPEQLLREVESARERERVVDERLDPYSGRRGVRREGRAERLGEVVRVERGVEGIVRARTWGVVGERCGDDGEGWEEALERWRGGR